MVRLKGVVMAMFARRAAVAAILLVGIVSGCGCPPERCGQPSILLVSVRNGDARLTDAVVMLLPEEVLFLSNGCEWAGPDWGCTHELLSPLPGRDHLLAMSDEINPGYGAWRPHVDIPVRVRVDTAGQYPPFEFDVSIHVNECGSIETPHAVVDFATGSPEMTVRRGPHGCERAADAE